MSSTASQLPEGFDSLEPFVDAWAIPDGAGRFQRRLTVTDADRLAFHQAATVQWGPALTALDKKPFGELDEKERRLMQLVLSFAHISLAVEVQGEKEGAHTAARRRFRITRSCDD